MAMSGHIYEEIDLPIMDRSNMLTGHSLTRDEVILKVASRVTITLKITTIEKDICYSVLCLEVRVYLFYTVNRI
jgi:hypothetical protein